MFQGSMTRIADAAHTIQHLLVKFGSAATHIAIAGVADAPIGVCNDTPALGDDAPVQLPGCAKESLTMVANGVIAAGARVFAAADGKVSALASTVNGTYYCVGVALEAAAADLAEIQVDPCIPFSVVVSGN
jgi:hypothetical protein